MNKIEIIRSQFEQLSLYTPPSQNCANHTQFRPINDEKTLGILKSMKNTTCVVYLCKINFFTALTGVLLRTWTKIIKTSLFNGSFLQSGKKLLSGCSSNLVNCIGNSKIINPSVIYYPSPNELQRLSSFNLHIL